MGQITALIMFCVYIRTNLFKYMFCIKSDVITLGSIEMYGFVTVWTGMDNGPDWVILLMYGSHDMRHTGFRSSGGSESAPHFNMSLWSWVRALTEAKEKGKGTCSYSL